MIHKTACVSFPRSGHHALKNVLLDYFGDSFRYCDNYIDPPEKRIETCPDTIFQKEHDLDLTVPVLPFRHLIQIRDPIESVQSWIDFDANVCAADYNSDREMWQRMFRDRLVLWQKWFEKWALAPISPRLIVSYKALVEHPFETCSKVILFMTSEHAHPDRLRGSLSRFPIVPQPIRGLRWANMI
jgi:hypothetical protein